jgi:hypothetical protein
MIGVLTVLQLFNILVYFIFAFCKSVQIRFKYRNTKIPEVQHLSKKLVDIIKSYYAYAYINKHLHNLFQVTFNKFNIQLSNLNKMTNQINLIQTQVFDEINYIEHSLNTFHSMVVDLEKVFLEKEKFKDDKDIEARLNYVLSQCSALKNMSEEYVKIMPEEMKARFLKIQDLVTEQNKLKAKFRM